jgi:hypothetical protein
MFTFSSSSSFAFFFAFSFADSCLPLYFYRFLIWRTSSSLAQVKSRPNSASFMGLSSDLSAL